MKPLNILLTVILTVAVLACGTFAGMQLNSMFVSKADSSLGAEFALAVRNYPNDRPATTSVSYLTVGGTPVSYIVPVEDADLIDANLYGTASTTSTVFRWTVSYSHNYDPSTGTGDWYGGDAVSVGSTASSTHSVAAHEHQWTPANGVASSTAKNFSVTPVASRYAKITFYVTGANGAVHMDTIIRKPLSGR